MKSLPLKNAPTATSTPRTRFVRLQNVDDIHAVVFLADEQQSLDVLCLAAGFDDIGRGILADVGNGRIEVGEFLERDDRDAVALEFLLAESAVVFEPVRVRRSADDILAGISQCFGLGTLAEDVVEDDDIRPVDMRFPVVDLRYETVADCALRFVFYVITDLVAFLDDLPGYVADQRID